MLRNINIGMILIFILAFRIHAQDAVIKWYWTYVDDSQSVIAYNELGVTNSLIEGVFPSNLYRLDEETAIVVLEQENQFSAYILTDRNAFLISPLYVGENLEMGYPDRYHYLESQGVEALILTYPYILIWNHDYILPQLFNRETHEIEALDLEVWDNIRVSENGQSLRYIVTDEVENNRTLEWRIIEFNILTDIVQTIYERNENAPNDAEFLYETCEPNQFGDKWFCTQSIGIYPPNGGLPLIENEIIHVDGYIEQITNNRYLKVGLDNDWYLVEADGYYQYCETNCFSSVTNYESGQTQEYDLSQINFVNHLSFSLNYSRVLDAGRILLFDSQNYEYYLLESDHTLTYLGIQPCCHIAWSSIDGRWLILFDNRSEDNLATILVDLQTGEIVLRENGIIDLFGFTSRGVYMWGNIFYSYENGETFIVDVEGHLFPGLIVDVLSTRQAIGYWFEGWIDVPAGLYITSLENGRELIIPNAQPIFLPHNFELQ